MSQVGLDKLSMFLRKKSFGSRINQRLYCSEVSWPIQHCYTDRLVQVTKCYVLKKFPLMPERCITSLTPHEPHLLHVYDGRDMFRLRVTGIPSHFCSGSLMFLFERLEEAEEEAEEEVEPTLLTVTSLTSL